MENFAREIYLLEQRQHHLTQHLQRKQQIAEAIAAIEQTRPTLMTQIATFWQVLAQVKKIRIEVSVVLQEPVIEKAGY